MGTTGRRESAQEIEAAVRSPGWWYQCVGGNAGFFSLQMMKRGAKSCTIVESFVEFCGSSEVCTEPLRLRLRLCGNDSPLTSEM